MSNSVFNDDGNPPVFQPLTIPAELQALPQWVCWHYETRNGKTTKPPIDAKSNGQLRYAKSNNPATWSDFETAVAAATRLKLPGIGLMVSADDRLTGLDLDHVIDPVTGELDPLVIEVLERFKDTYTEISPSGTGFRIWCYGKAARSGKCEGARKWLEVYTHPSNRHLTTTGNRYGAATAVTKQQAALDWLHGRFMPALKKASTEREGKPSSSPVESAFDLDDTALLTKARKTKNGVAFDALWSGDLSAHNGDHSAADLALLNLLAFWTGKDAARMDRLFRQSGLMRPKWDVVHDPANGRTYGQMTLDKAVTDGRDTFTGKKPGAKATLPRAATATAKQVDAGSELNPYRGTDDANADLFLRQHGQDVRFCPPWDKWLLWSGSHWRIDDRLDIDRIAADLPRHLYKSASDSTDSDQRKRVAKLANDLEKVNRRNTLLIAARHKVVVHHSDLDKGHFLLNASNGTIDLTTGRLRPHERGDLLTHDTEISFDSSAEAPTWLAFLHSTFGGDADLIQFVQRAIGYSLTGDVREQVLLICHGVGSNGKSVFLNIVQKLLGSLAWQAAPDLLMADKQRRHPTEQADLFGKRAIICQETGEGRRFNETLVKQLTGGDTITARRMHEDFWQFKPTHKLWLSTNHKPEIRGTDYAIWRRIRLIPFNVKFTDDGDPRKDPDMERKLTAELPGILAWAVAGCLDWQRHGLKQPQAVKDATADYQAEMDVLAAWLAECCIIGKRYEAKAADLYASYSHWCEQSGEHPENQRKWGMRLTDRGFVRFSGGKGYAHWRGIGLLTFTERGEVNEVDDVDDVDQKRQFSDPFLNLVEKLPNKVNIVNMVNPTTGERMEPTEPDLAVFQAVSESRGKIAFSGSVGSVNQNSPVKTKTVCSLCRYLVPTQDGGKCLIHKQTITAIREYSCSEWAARGLIGGVK